MENCENRPVKHKQKKVPWYNPHPSQPKQQHIEKRIPPYVTKGDKKSKKVLLLQKEFIELCLPSSTIDGILFRFPDGYRRRGSALPGINDRCLTAVDADTGPSVNTSAGQDSRRYM